MADQDAFDPTQFGAVAVAEPQTFDPTQHGAIPVEQPQTQEPSGFEKVLNAAQQGIGYAQKGVQFAMNPGAEFHKLMFPAEAKLTESPLVSPQTLTSVVQALQTPQRAILKGAFGDTGERLSEASGRFLGEQLSGLTSPENLALLAVEPAIGKLGAIRPPAIPKLGEVAGIVPPEAAATTAAPLSETAAVETATQPGQFTTEVPATADQSARNLEAQHAELQRQAADIQSRIDTQRTAASSAPIPEEQAAVNREIAPITEPPSATAESFPSISQSAEDARRTELQQEPPKVREAISLEEIRLMRERDELNAQNEIARQATGATHPAVDERLGQIDGKLTDIANEELQKSAVEQKPVEPQEVIQDATQEGQVPEGVQSEHTGNDRGGLPAKTGGGGSVQSETQVVGQPAEAGQIEPATAAPVQAESAEPEGTGISNRRLTEAYGDAAPVATTGKGPGAWKDEGLSRLDSFQKTGDAKNDPYSVLTNLREGKVPVSQLPSDVSLLRAEHQRLLEDARNAEGTPEYAAKSQAALDMATAIKGVAHGPASDVFRALQEYDKPRYDNVTDFDQALRERENRESTPEEKTGFRKIAEDVSSTRNGAEKEINGAQKQISKYPRMSFDDAAKNIHDQITELTKNCAI